jgi:hypothetical protein
MDLIYALFRKHTNSAKSLQNYEWYGKQFVYCITISNLGNLIPVVA